MFLDGRRREMRSCTSKGSKEKKFKTALPRRNRQLTPLAHWHSKPLSEPELSEMATESRLVCHLGSWPLPNGAHQHGLRKWRCALLPRRLLHFAATPENHAVQPPLDRDSDRKRATERCGRCPSLLTQEVICMPNAAGTHPPADCKLDLICLEICWVADGGQIHVGEFFVLFCEVVVDQNDVMILSSLPCHSSLGSVLFSVKSSVQSLGPVPGNTICFFDTFFSDATRAAPRQISEGFIPECDDIIMEQDQDEPPGLRSLRDLGRSILASFRHVLPSRRRPARRRRKKGHTARCCNARRRECNMASHPRKLSHLTLIRLLCVLSRSAQRFLSVRALGPLQITGIPSGK